MPEELEPEKQNTLFVGEEQDVAEVTYLADEEQLPAAAINANGQAVGPSNQPYIPAWWLSASAAVLVIGLADWLVSELGRRWYWSELTIYIGSLTIIFFIILGQAIYLRRKTSAARPIYLINGLTALIAGCLLSVGRFIGQTAFWTFFNILAQPINAVILSWLATWIGLRFFVGRPVASVPAAFIGLSAKAAPASLPPDKPAAADEAAKTKIDN